MPDAFFSPIIAILGIYSPAFTYLIDISGHSAAENAAMLEPSYQIIYFVPIIRPRNIGHIIILIRRIGIYTQAATITIFAYYSLPPPYTLYAIYSILSYCHILMLYATSTSTIMFIGLIYMCRSHYFLTYM